MSTDRITAAELELPVMVADSIASWARTIAKARPENLPGVLGHAARDLFRTRRVVANGNADLDALVNQEIVDALNNWAQSAGMDDDTAQQIFADAAAPSDLDSWVQADRAKRAKANGGAAPSVPLSWTDMSNWDNEPRPEREWVIPDRVPLNQIGLFSGEGGAGKSIIEMMKDVAHVTGKDWLGSLPAIGPAFYLGAEDDEKEIHIRFYDIAQHYGVTFQQLINAGLKVLCQLGQDATLCTSTRSGKVETTNLYKQLYEAAGDIKPKNISIDTLSRAFAGNEIDRVQVYAFAMHMQALAMVAHGSVTVLSHPSLQGIASGSGISGSTAWHGAFRFRQYLASTKPENGEQPDNDLRQIEFKKNQYGPSGDRIVLRYQRGLFLPVTAIGMFEKIAEEQHYDNLFLELLDKHHSQGRNVSHLKKSNSYAPSIFSNDPKAKAPGSHKALTDAMERLFDAKKIKVGEYGKQSNRHYRIVRREQEE